MTTIYYRCDYYHDYDCDCTRYMYHFQEPQYIWITHHHHHRPRFCLSPLVHLLAIAADKYDYNTLIWVVIRSKWNVVPHRWFKYNMITISFNRCCCYCCFALHCCLNSLVATGTWTLIGAHYMNHLSLSIAIDWLNSRTLLSLFGSLHWQTHWGNSSTSTDKHTLTHGKWEKKVFNKIQKKLVKTQSDETKCDVCACCACASLFCVLFVPTWLASPWWWQSNTPVKKKLFFRLMNERNDSVVGHRWWWVIIHVWVGSKCVFFRVPILQFDWLWR